MVSGLLALVELLVSKLPMNGKVILWTVCFFAVNAVLEGAITLGVLQAIERLNGEWIRKPAASHRTTVAALAGFAVLLAAAGFLLASAAPDGLQRIGIATGVAENAAFHAPLAGYSLPLWSSYWGRRASAGVAGLVLLFGLCAAAGRILGLRTGGAEKQAKCTT
jgi:hypothetical protein